MVKMTIPEALKMLDDAVPRLHGLNSVVYPGLTAHEAVCYIVEILVDMRKEWPEGIQVSPKVEIRVRQIAVNKCDLTLGPDPRVAKVFRAGHPLPEPKLPHLMLPPAHVTSVKRNHKPRHPKRIKISPPKPFTRKFS